MVKKRQTQIDVIENRKINGFWRSNPFRLALNSVLKIEARRIYQLSDPLINSKYCRLLNLTPKAVSIKKVYANLEKFDWPCNPRSYPLAFEDTTHDVPGFSVNSNFHVIAWSARGQIAASFGQDLVMWLQNTCKTVVYKVTRITALSYNPDGDVLAIGWGKNRVHILQLWDVSRDKILHHMNRHVFKSKANEIYSLEWDPTGEFLACGTFCGNIFIFRLPNFEVYKHLKVLKLRVHSIKFSPKNNYMAASDSNGNICVWHWRSCILYLTLASSTLIKVNIAWHPWNGVDLVISEQLPASIQILHVPSKQVVGYYHRKDYTCAIDAIIFNRLSAELVVSYTFKHSDECLRSEVLVMSSLDRIVDVLEVHDERVKFLLWSPDGMQLATVSDNDTLTIWNFFATLDKKLENKRKPTTLLPKRVSFSQFDLLNSIK